MRVSRGRFLALAGATSGGLVVGTGIGRSLSNGDQVGEGPTAAGARIAFRGEHQPGVTTDPQGHLYLASFDVAADRLDTVRDLFASWTAAAERMHSALPTGGSAPADSGETSGLGAARLSLTFGLGPRFFDLNEAGLDLRGVRPPSLGDLPSFRGDRLEPDLTGGDLCIQACADDPQVALHAVRNLAALGRGAVVVRWVQQGFRSTPPADSKASRNLLGFNDGTNNLDPVDQELMARNVWVGPEDEPAWMRGGTYMVVRRIRMRIEHWDSVSLEEQERTFGRRKVSGAPLGGETESDPVDPAKLPPDCHIVQANPRTPGSEAERILRRSYSFSDGFDARFGELDAGLFFICFQRDPRKQFIPIQARLAENDHLSEYTFHTGSAIFAIPPGVRKGEYIGQTLLEAV
jgi:deferrochelatase/peroxidase EfeB